MNKYFHSKHVCAYSILSKLNIYKKKINKIHALVLTSAGS